MQIVQFGNGTGALRADRAVARAPHVGPPVPSVSAADWQGPFSRGHGRRLLAAFRTQCRSG